MRNTFIDELTLLAESDERVVLLTGDMGFSVIEKFAEKFPKRFYNIGIAEQNMIGIATGLAEAGFIPFCYSIAPFALLRPYEFIKNGPILHNLPVRIVAIGAGFEYGDLGFTHYLLEDIALTRVHSNLECFAPFNINTAKKVLQETYGNPNPIYYRISKTNDNIINDILHQENDGIATIFENIQNKICVFCIGNSISQSYEALIKSNFGFNLYAITRYNPININHILSILSRHIKAITVEEHYVCGGLGGMIAEIIAENNSSPMKLKRLGIDKNDFGVVADYEHLKEHFKISAADILKNIT